VIASGVSCFSVTPALIKSPLTLGIIRPASLDICRKHLVIPFTLISVIDFPPNA
jgi:hypothetical protein